MAPPPNFTERLHQTLIDGLHKLGIDAAVEMEPVSGTLLHRVFVTSPQWSSLPHTERQEVVWRIVDASFPRDEQLYISGIWPLTPDEVDGRAA